MIEVHAKSILYWTCPKCGHYQEDIDYEYKTSSVLQCDECDCEFLEKEWELVE